MGKMPMPPRITDNFEMRRFEGSAGVPPATTERRAGGPRSQGRAAETAA